MKKLVYLLVSVAALALIPLSQAGAGISPTYRLIGHTPCGKPIYSYFRVQGYDSCGRPVGCWIEQYPASCRCRAQRPARDSGDQAGVPRGSGSDFQVRFPR